jgi:hypothetical protein
MILVEDHFDSRYVTFQSNYLTIISKNNIDIHGGTFTNNNQMSSQKVMSTCLKPEDATRNGE